MTRNLAKYPITKQEILDYLTNLLDEQCDTVIANPGNASVGSLDMMYISEAIKIIEGVKDYEFTMHSYPN